MKNFFKKIGGWFKRHKPTKRRLIQLYAALLSNANLKGFFSGKIYSGNTKYACVPGLNCYSCPGAIGACPLGALQNALASSDTRAPFYVIGIILLFGLLLGRTICGFLCPMGLLQELLYKIKSPKLKKSRVTRILSYFKYVLLAVLVVGIPLVYSSVVKVPSFCKYICPVGTLGGAVALLINPTNAELYAMLGPLFTWKFIVMVAILVGSVFVFRLFCRFLCPLGALYGFFNKISILGVKLDKNKCTDCGLCINRCKMDIRHVGDHECINCGECIDVCPAKAISWKGSKWLVHENAQAAATAGEDVRPLGALLTAIPANQTAGEGAQANVQAPAQDNVAQNQAEHEVAATDNIPVEEQAREVSAQESAQVKPEHRWKKRGRAFWLEVIAWSVALVVLVGALLYYNVFDRVTGTVVLEEGDELPEFTYSVYNGSDEDTYTTTDSRGKILILNFWYTQCGPCVSELPEFEQFYQDYSDQVTIVAVHSYSFIFEDVTEFITVTKDWGDYGIIFVQDEEFEQSESEDLATSYEILGGLSTWPMTVVVDQEGVIYARRQGSTSYEELLELVQPLLSEE